MRNPSSRVDGPAVCTPLVRANGVPDQGTPHSGGSNQRSAGICTWPRVLDATPQGRGKIERFYLTITTELLPHLPGYIPHGTRGRPSKPAELTLEQLDQILEKFIVTQY